MKKYENFCASLNNLKDVYQYEAPYENVVLIGLVALYGICFEQSWKAMKECLIEHGISESATGSPKQILKAAFQTGMIVDEALWLDALVSRNNISHAYNQKVALEILEKTKTSYYEMFCALQKELEDNWIS